ncbi:hypothetical protein OB955_10525 [Halobacteria archaeon AArc-m2/3/4]|uniref:Uncharacterized protein n=1 Tax=Natronoglomus mannanivorans TaxID=2979990 RepID=A0ABT2QE25_9EURY|nr:hypothetical protein [Halobacteria archaeon AArc-m2/3/4]
MSEATLEWKQVLVGARYAVTTGQDGHEVAIVERCSDRERASGSSNLP